MTASRKMDQILSRSFWGFRIVLDIEGRSQILFIEATGPSDPSIESKLVEIPSGAIVKSCDFGLWP